MNANKRGGSRPGAGRPRRKEPTLNVTIRIPERLLRGVREKYGKSLTELITKFLLTLVNE